jgi:predicted O-methyltransferase YrrM
VTEAARTTTDPFADIWARASGFEGWLTEGQARMLWDAAVGLASPAVIVEIGSFRGRSTSVLAAAAGPGVAVYAVDPHAGGDRGPNEIRPEADRGEADHRAFLANLDVAGVAGRVRHVRQRSADALGAVEGPADLLFVDGAHRYGPARDDIVAWGARVPDGGVMLIHDAWNAVGVTLAQLRVLVFGSRWAYEGRSRSLARYRRRDLRGRERVRNALRQLRELLVFVRLALVKVAVVARLRPLARLLGLPRGDAWPY